MGQLIRGADEYCLNFGFLGRGASDPGATEETVAGGGLGVKIHEDFGATPAAINGSLIAADRNDFAVHIHTDTINEFGYCEDTLAAVAGRVIHMYHVEGAGGGHSPDILKVNAYTNVIPSSTNPTNPFTPLALEEGVPMTMLAHIMNFNLPEDVAFAECRIRTRRAWPPKISCTIWAPSRSSRPIPRAWVGWRKTSRNAGSSPRS